MNNNEYKDYEEEKPKKFQLTRGMLILGAIILLAIIIVIIVISSVINNNKKDLYTISNFTTLEGRMLEEAPIYVSQKGIVLTTEETKIDLESLLSKNGGNINQDKLKATKVCKGYVIATKNDTETYNAYISCGNYYITKGYVDNTSDATTTTTKKVKDTTKPDLVLIDGVVMTVEKGTKFTDPGAKATDNVDGDITSNIKVTGTVDTSKTGTYKITYQVSDKVGNTTKKIRTVTVKAGSITTTKSSSKITTKVSARTTKTPTVTVPRLTTPPTITMYGESITTISVGNSYSRPSCTAKDAYGNTVTNISYSSNVNTSLAGTYSTTCTAKDSYGNVASKTQTVIVKNTTVQVSSISITPDGASINVGQSQQLTIYFTPSNATNKSVTYSSSNPAVATVSGTGLITGRSSGRTTITVTTSNGVSKTASITIK